MFSGVPRAAKSLEKVERDVPGPAKAELDIPQGITMGAVHMNLETRELVDISDRVTGGRRLACDVPAGPLKVMARYRQKRGAWVWARGAGEAGKALVGF